MGLLVHYIENLRTPKSRPYGLGDPDQRLCSVPAAEELPSLPDAVGTRGMILILGGYSYGSLITTLLPTTDIILHRFESVTKGTAEAEIRLRAASLSTQWNKDAQLYREAQNVRRSESLRSSTRTMAVAVGGDESKLGSQRPSYESRRSFDAVRKSMERSRKKLRLRQHSSETLENDLLEKSLAPANIDLPRTHYFLVSPLLSPISMLVMMFSSFRSESQTHCEGKLLTHPALAVYGDNDFFTSQRKLRRWAEDLAAKPKSRFQFHEIAGAGHFWREEGVDAQMRGFLERWLQDLITGSQVA